MCCVSFVVFISTEEYNLVNFVGHFQIFGKKNTFQVGGKSDFSISEEFSLSCFSKSAFQRVHNQSKAKETSHKTYL